MILCIYVSSHGISHERRVQQVFYNLDMGEVLPGKCEHIGIVFQYTLNRHGVEISKIQTTS